jgi:predicted RNase H-like nuclease (RuvC/YqgF family)
LKKHITHLESQLHDLSKAKDDEINDLQHSLKVTQNEVKVLSDEIIELKRFVADSILRSEYDEVMLEKNSLFELSQANETRINNLEQEISKLTKTIHLKESTIKKLEIGNLPNWDYISYNCSGSISEWGIMCRGLDFNDTIVVILRQLLLVIQHINFQN